LAGWIKVNTNGVVIGSLGLVAYVGIFRWGMEEFVGGFSSFLGSLIFFFLSSLWALSWRLSML